MVLNSRFRAWSHILPGWSQSPFRRMPGQETWWCVPVAMAALGMMALSTGMHATAGDLSRYRQFQFGSDVRTVAQQIDKLPADATALHSRPSEIRQLEWRPQPLGPSEKSEAVKEVLFSFFEDELYRVEVLYDRYETEGLTNQDVIAAISKEYGIATTGEPQPSENPDALGDPGTLIAEWKDKDHVFQLLRFDYGPTFKLIGTYTELKDRAAIARVESERLDAKEAPQREADRLAREAEAERAANEAARKSNKRKFQP